MSGSLTGAASSVWFTAFPKAAAGDVRLLCLPHAGAGANLYRTWTSLLPPWILVSPIQLPGREERYAEKLRDSIDSLSRELADAVAELVREPFVLFGYSMGALIAFETARRLSGIGGPMPLGVIAAAHQAPQHLMNKPAMAHLPDSEFLRELRAMGGMPDELFDYPELLEFVLPILRADFTACEDYRYLPQSRLKVPLAIFSGDRDPHVSPELLTPWQVHTSQCEFHSFAGGHFFLREQRDSMLSTLAEVVQRWKQSEGQGCLVATHGK